MQIINIGLCVNGVERWDTRFVISLIEKLTTSRIHFKATDSTYKGKIEGYLSYLCKHP